MLKPIFLKTSFLAAGALAALAGPLEQSRIASEAKWIVHIDVEGMRQSALGGYLLNELVKPMLEDAEEIKHANLSINLTNISSVTAYGAAFKQGPEGVLMISTTADIKKDLDTLAGMFYLQAGTNSPFLLVEKEPLPLYSFAKSVFFTPAENTLFVAKSKEQIERAHQVVQGKADSLVKSSSFRNFQAAPRSFVSVAVADGFIGTAGIPPQAQILREATGGRLCLGERDDNIFLKLVFQGKDDMASTRIQQVLQGILALVSLSQQDQEITQLAGATRITSEGRDVLVNLEYPVTKTIQKIKTSTEDKPKSKGKPKKQSRPAAADEDAPPSSEIEKKQ